MFVASNMKWHFVQKLLFRVYLQIFAIFHCYALFPFSKCRFKLIDEVVLRGIVYTF